MVKLRCINPFSGNFKTSLRVVGFFLEFPYQVPDTCLKVPRHCSDVDPPLSSTGTRAGGQEGKGMRKITADMMAKQEQLSAEAKRVLLHVCLQGACLNLRSSEWEEAENLWRHKNIKRPNTRAKASWWRGFLDLAIKVKLRTKTSTKSFINEKRTWKHMNHWT